VDIVKYILFAAVPVIVYLNMTASTGMFNQMTLVIFRRWGSLFLFA